MVGDHIQLWIQQDEIRAGLVEEVTRLWRTGQGDLQG